MSRRDTPSGISDVAMNSRPLPRADYSAIVESNIAFLSALPESSERVAQIAALRLSAETYRATLAERSEHNCRNATAVAVLTLELLTSSLATMTPDDIAATLARISEKLRSASRAP